MQCQGKGKSKSRKKIIFRIKLIISFEIQTEILNMCLGSKGKIRNKNCVQGGTMHFGSPNGTQSMISTLDLQKPSKSISFTWIFSWTWISSISGSCYRQ